MENLRHEVAALRKAVEELTASLEHSTPKNKTTSTRKIKKEEESKKVVAYISSHGDTTTQEVQTAMNYHSLGAASRILKQLVLSGSISWIGRGTYRVRSR